MAIDMKTPIIAFERGELSKHIVNLCYRYNNIMETVNALRKEANAETPANLSKLENAITLENRAHKFMAQFDGICNFISDNSDVFFFVKYETAKEWYENALIASVIFDWQFSEYSDEKAPEEIPVYKVVDENNSADLADENGDIVTLDGQNAE